MMHSIHQPIGILGGTFDPIHIGHLRVALEAHDTLKLSKVHLIPCYQPVHRHNAIASAERRLEMVEYAVKKEPGLYADPREINRKGPSYTITTLEELRREMPERPLCLLVGMDAFLDFLTWHRFDEILNKAHLIIAHRPSFQLPEKGPLLDLINTHLQREIAYFHENLAGGIFLLPITALEVSATGIRKQIAMGRNPRYLLPDNVYEYIQQHGTYKT